MKMNMNILYVGLGAAALVGCLGLNSGNPLNKKDKGVASINSSSTASIDSKVSSSSLGVCPIDGGGECEGDAPDHKYMSPVPKSQARRTSVDGPYTVYFLPASNLAAVSSRIYASAAPRGLASDLASSSIASINSGASNLGELLNQNKLTLVLRYNNKSLDDDIQLRNRRAVSLLNELKSEFKNQVNFAVYKARDGESLRAPFGTMPNSGLTASPNFVLFEGTEENKSPTGVYLLDLTNDSNVSQLYSDLHKKLSE